jgi:hypothetical protein
VRDGRLEAPLAAAQEHLPVSGVFVQLRVVGEVLKQDIECREKPDIQDRHAAMLVRKSTGEETTFASVALDTDAPAEIAQETWHPALFAGDHLWVQSDILARTMGITASFDSTGTQVFLRDSNPAARDEPAYQFKVGVPLYQDSEEHLYVPVRIAADTLGVMIQVTVPGAPPRDVAPIGAQNAPKIAMEGSLVGQTIYVQLREAAMRAGKGKDLTAPASTGPGKPELFGLGDQPFAVAGSTCSAGVWGSLGDAMPYARYSTSRGPSGLEPMGFLFRCFDPKRCPIY